MHSKSKVDKAGRNLSRERRTSEDEEIISEIIFDDYREAHLQPLTELTHQIQTWLTDFQGNYYIAQRLKRKPQIIRKMKRFSVRLSQLQDIAGNRIIVDKNDDVERLRRFIRDKLSSEQNIKIFRETDYRPEGRDDTGYRALHIILEKENKKIELQLRSRAQHYWAESIERTSVIYGKHLKENSGDTKVLEYFKLLSHIFFEIESRREPTPHEKMQLDEYRKSAEEIIEAESSGASLDSYVNEDVINTLHSVEASKKGQINNWLLIFDWNSGHFVNWLAISRDPKEAYKIYRDNEMYYGENDGYEVVLVGSSDVSMIRRTHSHYFGIEGYDGILENLEESVIGFTGRKSIDSGSRRILHVLTRKNFWGKRTVRLDTLKNHYCKSVFGIETSIEELLSLGLIHELGNKELVSLNRAKKDEIDSYL